MMTGRSIRLLAAGLIAGASLLACDGESDDLAPILGSNAEQGPDVSAPTMTDLTRALSLSDTQVSAISPALDEWRSGAREERTLPPAMRFVMDSAPVLSQGQTTALLKYLGSQTGAGDRERRPRHARMGGGGLIAKHALRGVLADLDVDADTRAKVQTLLRETGDASRSIMADYHDGTLTAEALKDKMGALRVATETSLEAMVGPDAMARVRAKAEDLRGAMADRQREHKGDMHERRVAFLSAVLSLDEGQVTKLKAVFEAGAAERNALAQSLRDGNVAPEDVLVEHLTMRKAHEETLRSLLDPEQIETLDALNDFHPVRARGDRHPGRRGEGRHARNRG